jgi:hypothetical protein
LAGNVARVWHRFAYTSYHPFDRDITVMRELAFSQWQTNGKASHASEPAPVWGSVHDDDAFMTLMAMLFGRAQQRSVKSRE